MSCVRCQCPTYYRGHRITLREEGDGYGGTRWKAEIRGVYLFTDYTGDTDYEAHSKACEAIDDVNK